MEITNRAPLPDAVWTGADAGVKIPHRETDDIAAELEEQDLAVGMKVTGDWPFGEN